MWDWIKGCSIFIRTQERGRHGTENLTSIYKFVKPLSPDAILLSFYSVYKSTYRPTYTLFEFISLHPTPVLWFWLRPVCMKMKQPLWIVLQNKVLSYFVKTIKQPDQWWYFQYWPVLLSVSSFCQIENLRPGFKSKRVHMLCLYKNMRQNVLNTQVAGVCMSDLSWYSTRSFVMLLPWLQRCVIDMTSLHSVACNRKWHDCNRRVPCSYVAMDKAP